MMPVWGCRTLNSQQHIGLQQLMTLAAAASSLLGPSKRYKFVEDGEVRGESVLVGSALRLLENLDTGCAVGQMLLETAQAQHKAFHTGVGTLLLLAGRWSAAALECLRDGIPVHDIVTAMSEGLESCTEVCWAESVTIREAVLSTGAVERSWTACPAAPTQGAERALGPLEGTLGGAPVSLAHIPLTANVFGRRGGQLSQDNEASVAVKFKARLRHSRHFNEREGTAMLESGPERSHESTSSPLTDFECQDVARLAALLCHGNDRVTKLVIEASGIQTANFSKNTFDVRKLVTCLMPSLSEEHSCVTSGMVTFVSLEQALLVERLQDRDLHVCLFSGDLTENYRHLGFNRPSDMTHVVGSVSSAKPGGEAEWAAGISESLFKLNVNMVLANGVMSTVLSDACLRLGILTVDRVRPSVLKDFAEATGAVPVAYAMQMSERCVGAAARVSFWPCLGERGLRLSRPVAINIRVGGGMLVTAVIASAVHAELKALEDTFWSYAYRLHYALQDHRLLPGAGRTEMLCVRHLQSLAQSNVPHSRDLTSSSYLRAAGLYRVTVLLHMSSGWMDFIATLMHNTGQCPSKLEAWTLLRQNLTDGHLWINQLTGMNSADGAQAGGAVYDNVTAKLEAWRRALDLVLMVLQTDMEIITGFSTTEPQAVPADVVLL